MNNKVSNLLLFLILAGYAGLWIFAANEFSRGQAAFDANDWLMAQKHFERAVGLYNFAFPPHAKEALILTDQAGLLLLGENKFDSGDYKSALDAYTSFVSLYPETAAHLPMTELISSTYAEWIKSLHNDGRYEQAIEASQILLDTYSETAAAASVGEILPAIYMDWGISLLDKSDFAGAVEKFELVIKEYAQSSSSDPARKAGAETYREWGDALSEAEEYEASIEKYQIILKEFPTQPAAQGIKDILSELYLKWADQLRNTKQHELALEKYNFIISSFGGTSAAAEATTLLSPLMLEWTEVLHEDKQFAKEVELLLRLITDYEETHEAQQASQKIFAAYESLGQQLMNDNSFILAIQTYDDARKFAVDRDDKSLVDTGYKDAVQALATDTGKDGDQVISETFESACARQRAASPAVGILKDVPDKIMVCGGNLRIPAELRPTIPGEFKYVVLVSTELIRYSTCRYTGGHQLVLQVYAATANVYSAATGNRITSRTFRGSAPEGCPGVFAFSGPVGYLAGPKVNSADIVAWVKSILKKS